MENSRSDEIAETLENRILTRELEDGARLDEIKLAEEFQVSRTPIREALQKLTKAGLVEQRPRRGVFVKQPSPLDLLEMFEVMAELEATCGRLAALRISETALEGLKAANAKCQQALDDKDADQYYAENETFHFLIYREAGNGFLEAETLRLHRRLKPYRRLQLRLRGRMAQSMEEHIAIVDALEAGEGQKVDRLLRNHVAVQGDKFQRLMATLKENGVA